MNNRERILTAIAHKEGDRVPKGEICIEAGLANRFLGKDYPNDYQHYERDLDIRKVLHMDLVNLGDWPSVEIGVDANGNKVYRSAYGYEYIYNGKSKHITKPPIDDIEDADKYKMPDIRKVSGDLIRQFRDTTDLFVFGQIGGPVSMLDEMFPMEDYMVYCLTNTSEMKIISEKVMEYEVQKAKLFIDCGADGIYIADDIAFNSGVFLPPQKMEELVFPFYKEAIKEIKKYKNVPVFFHSDGDLRKVMGRIVDSGFDGLQSLQPSAGMDIGEVKKDYGDALCLMGNIDLDYVMTFAPPEVVADTVKKTIDIAAPGGGFILSTCNTLITAIPDANVSAMYGTAHEYGVYNKDGGIL
jgi:Uroporphyrinogen-III decarboxylase